MRTPLPEMTCSFLIQLVFFKKKNYKSVEQIQGNEILHLRSGFSPCDGPTYAFYMKTKHSEKKPATFIFTFNISETSRSRRLFYTVVVSIFD